MFISRNHVRVSAFLVLRTWLGFSWRGKCNDQPKRLEHQKRNKRKLSLVRQPNRRRVFDNIQRSSCRLLQYWLSWQVWESCRLVWWHDTSTLATTLTAHQRASLRVSISRLLGSTLPKALDDSHRASLGPSGVSEAVLVIIVGARCRRPAYLTSSLLVSVMEEGVKSRLFNSVS